MRKVIHRNCFHTSGATLKPGSLSTRVIYFGELLKGIFAKTPQEHGWAGCNGLVAGTGESAIPHIRSPHSGTQ